MTTRLRSGPRDWRMIRDTEGHREYKVTFLVESDDPGDGPSRALLTPGLPLPGAIWLIDNEIDLWAWCRWDVQVTPLVINEPNREWELSYTFSTKPPSTSNGKGGCKETQVEDPLLEPQQVSGGFTRYTEEAVYDRFGRLIRNSAFEQVRGPQVEFDKNRATIRIEQNVASLGSEIWEPMRDTLNAYPLWGYPARCVKLSNVSWVKKFYGNCYPYYTRTFDFETYLTVSETTGTLVSGFDRDLIDQGNKVLSGRYDPATGSGATVFVGYTSGGGIASAVLSAAGSGYPRNTYVPLHVYNTGVPGTGGVVILKTTASGVGDHIAWTHKPGSGYLSGGPSPRATVQRGGWVLDAKAIVYTNPQNYCQYKDKANENATAVLDGYGLPIGDDPDPPGVIHVEKYGESDFLLLGIPVAL